MNTIHCYDNPWLLIGLITDLNTRCINYQSLFTSNLSGQQVEFSQYKSPNTASFLFAHYLTITMADQAPIQGQNAIIQAAVGQADPIVVAQDPAAAAVGPQVQAVPRGEEQEILNAPQVVISHVC